MKENCVKEDENKGKIKKNEREFETKNEESGVKYIELVTKSKYKRELKRT